MSTVERDLAALETRVGVIERDVDVLRNEIGHAGKADTIRGRLHIIENYNAAAEAAKAATAAAGIAHAALERTRSTARERRWTLSIAAFNVLVVLAGVILTHS